MEVSKLEKSTEDIMREVIDAKDNAVERAGIVKISDIGDTESGGVGVSPIHKYRILKNVIVNAIQ